MNAMISLAKKNRAIHPNAVNTGGATHQNGASAIPNTILNIPYEELFSNKSYKGTRKFWLPSKCTKQILCYSHQCTSVQFENNFFVRRSNSWERNYFYLQPRLNYKDNLLGPDKVRRRPSCHDFLRPSVAVFHLFVLPSCDSFAILRFFCHLAIL